MDKIVIKDNPKFIDLNLAADIHASREALKQLLIPFISKLSQIPIEVLEANFKKAFDEEREKYRVEHIDIIRTEPIETPSRYETKF